MADGLQQNTVPVPEGATIGDASQAPQSSPVSGAVPIPQGAQVGEPGFMDKAMSFGSDMIKGFGKGAEDTAHGIASMANRVDKAIGLGGVDEWLNKKLSGAMSSDEGKKLIESGKGPTHEQALGAMAEQAKPKNLAEGIGYGGEMLTEFLLGDAALKGLSLAEKMTRIGKVAKILEDSPRLMKALKAGAAIGKASAELSPEEAALIKQYPTIARLVSLGMDSIRAGATQAAQTTVRTGGDVGEGVKQGAEMVGLNAVIGAPFAAAGGAMAKVKNAKETVDTLGKMAEQAPAQGDLTAGISDAVKNAKNQVHEAFTTGINPKIASAPEKAEMVEAVSDGINAAEKNMHTKFQNGIDELRDTLTGSVPVKDSPISKFAAETLGESAEKAKSTHPIVGMTVDSGQKLDPQVRGILKSLSTGKVPLTQAEMAANAAKSDTEMMHKALSELYPGKGFKDLAANELSKVVQKAQELKVGQAKVTSKAAPNFNIDDLIQLRQNMRKMAEQYAYGDINARTLRKALYAVDDTIDDLAKAGTGDVPREGALDAYKKLRETYKQERALFDSPAMNKLTTQTPGQKVNDVGQYITSGFNSLDKINALKKAVGDGTFKQLSDSVLKGWTDAATDEATGLINPDKFAQAWNKMKPEVREALFDSGTIKDVEGLLKNHEAIGAPFTNRVVKNLEAGNLNEVGQELIGGKTSVANIEEVRKVIGDEKMGDLAKGIFETWTRDAMSNNGVVNTKRLIDKWAALKPEVRDALFRDVKPNPEAFAELMKDAKSAQAVKNLVKAGLLSGSAGAAGHFAGPLFGLVSLGLEGGFQVGRDILEYVANHPYMWKTLGGLSKAAAVGEKVTTPAAKIGAKEITDQVNKPDNKEKLKSTLQSVSPALAGE